MSKQHLSPGRLIHIPTDEWDALKELAREGGTTASAIIRDAVRKILSHHNRLPAVHVNVDVVTAPPKKARKR